MKIAILNLLLSTANLVALDADAIRKIAAEPHSRENLVAELKLYPEAREYKITESSGKTTDSMEAGPAVVASEKTVQGRYIVTKAMLPGTKDPMIMVVSYEKETDTFKKWVLLPNDIIGSSTGVADFDKRTIAWIADKTPDESVTTILTIETHADNKSSWKTTIQQDGKIIAISRGFAVKTK